MVYAYGQPPGGVLVAKKVSNPIDVHVGDRVKVRRVELGLSQTQLGQALGITFQQVQKYEKGANRISASRLQQVSDILKVPASYFFKGSPGEMKAKGNASPVGRRCPNLFPRMKASRS